MFINSSLLCFLNYCTFYCPLGLVLVYTPLIGIYNPRYVVYKPDILLLLKENVHTIPMKINCKLATLFYHS